MAKLSVPFFDLAAANGGFRDDLLSATARLLDGGGFMAEEETGAFETEFAATLGVTDCVAVGSGTDALRLILAGLGARRPDTILAAPNISPVVADAVLKAGPRLDFADVDPFTGLLDPDRLEERLKDDSLPRPLAVIPAHLYGQCAPMEALEALAQKYEFAIIEDARQSCGATRKGRPAGSFGLASAFCFSPEKNLGALGQAGLVATSDPELAASVRKVRDQGLGLGNDGRVELADSRMDAMQAAVLRVKLAGLASAGDRRRAVAAQYDKAFAGTGYTEPVATVPGNQPNRHIYAILVPDREDMRAWLDEQGVCTGVHYPVPLHLHPRFRRLGYKRGDFPAAEQFAQRTLSLPIRPELTQDQIALVVDAVRSFGGSMR